jgi:PAS domain S-box-containing protein
MSGKDLLQVALAQEQEHAVILLDDGARVVSWLAGATKTFGYEAQEMLGQSMDRIFTPEDRMRGDPEWELRTARSYGSAEDDRWQIRKDGIRIWVSGITSALRDADGTLLGYVKVARDRTDLRSHIETLQRRLEQASHTEGEKRMVLGTLAHELRNPLGPLMSAVELIRMVSTDRPQIQSASQIIERQVRFIEKLVEDLLETTRASVGKMTLRYETIELRSIVDRAIETCSAALKERAQGVVVLIPDSLSIEVDAVRLQQVLVNLISNSSKFSPEGNRIWIKATVDADELVFRVEDQGKGIPSKLLPKIFELFTQADPGGESRSNGLGLGLALVKAIVEMHGGTVQARSEGTGRGAEIIVRLPLRPKRLGDERR